MEKREDGLAPAPHKSLCESTDAKHFHIRQLRRQGMDYPTKRGGGCRGGGGVFSIERWRGLQAAENITYIFMENVANTLNIIHSPYQCTACNNLSRVFMMRNM